MKKILPVFLALGFLAGEAQAQQTLRALKNCNNFASLPVIQEIDTKELQANNIYLNTVKPELDAIAGLAPNMKGPRCERLKPFVEKWAGIARSILPLLRKAIPAM